MMQTRTVKFYNLSLSQPKTYLFAALFVIGNIALPQLCHLMPKGGLIFLPIYFFTLIAAYKYGWKVGLLTAVLSPLVNSTIFGMPAPAMLPIILIKSTLLALSAAGAAHLFKQINLITLLIVVLAYQTLGTIAEWAMTLNINTAVQDLSLGLPGLALQIIGGYLVIKYLIRK